MPHARAALAQLWIDGHASRAFNAATCAGVSTESRNAAEEPNAPDCSGSAFFAEGDKVL
jgi:hypothetical protein